MILLQCFFRIHAGTDISSTLQSSWCQFPCPKVDCCNSCYLILCFIYIFPFRNIKQTHLTLDGLLLHPPRKYITCCFPLCFYTARMKGLQHFTERPDICPLISWKKAEFSPAVLPCHRTPQAADPVKTHIIKWIYQQMFTVDVFPHIPVLPVHNRISDPFSFKSAAFK